MTDQEVITLKEYILALLAERDKVQKLRDEDVVEALSTAKEVEKRIKQLESNSSYKQGSKAGKEWLIGVGVSILVSIIALIIALMD